jgi:hypothetical protein
MTIQQNGTYTVYAITNADQSVASTTTINSIDKTRPVAKSVTYTPREDTCTKWPVVAKVVFYDGLNLTRLKDRISGFVGGSDAYNTRVPLVNWIDSKVQKLSKEYTFSSNGSHDEYATDLAGNKSLLTQINSTSVNWIKSTAPTISNLKLTPGPTGRVPFSFDIIDPSESDPTLSEKCKGDKITWSIMVVVGGVTKTIWGTGKAGDHITGTIEIPWAGDYTLWVTLTDNVGNTTTQYAGLAEDGTTKTSTTSFTTTQSSNSRVKILGAIGWQKAFDNNYSVGSKFNSSLFATTLNQIRKNVALLRRNIDLSSGEKTVNNTRFITGNKKYSDIKNDFPTDTIDSLIIIGWDLMIDKDILEPLIKKNSKWIIVIKNEAGDGGNIYISDSVKNIESSIFTEWSVFSGESKDTIYNNSAAKLTSLPSKQLYIKGSLISRNTILGGLSNICPYNIADCNPYQYDLDSFRNFDKTTANRAYPDNSLDAYSLIIERDPRISDTPPPGWEAR